MGKIKKFLKFILNSYAIRSFLPYNIRRALNLADEALNAKERRSTRKNVQTENSTQVKKETEVPADGQKGTEKAE